MATILAETLGTKTDNSSAESGHSYSLVSGCHKLRLDQAQRVAHYMP